MKKRKMSNKAPVAPAPAPVPAPAVVPAPAPKAVATEKPKKGFARFVAILSIAMCVVLLLPLISISVFTDAWVLSQQSLLTTVQALLASDVKAFGFLPAFVSGTGIIELGANLLIYLLLLAIVVSLVLSVISLFNGKRGLVIAELIVLALGTALYAVGVYLISSKKCDKAVLDIVVLAIAAVSILLIILLACVKPRKKAEEAPAPDPFEGFLREEYIEAYAYDGGPVAGVELAEEVNPTVAALSAARHPDMAAQATVASLLGNGFDPFLITLNEKEKNEFIDIYVLKCKGIMPEIPGYVVGGDNKDFFNKVFIYLGQYREKIPADLLGKMYQFSMKI